MVLTTTTSLLPGAEPFHFDAPGDFACLLVRGFTGSPNTAPAFNAEPIVASVPSPDRRLVGFDNCFHVVTVDFDAELVGEEVFKFIRPHSESLELPPAWDSSTPVSSQPQSPPASSLG